MVFTAVWGKNDTLAYWKGEEDIDGFHSQKYRSIVCRHLLIVSDFHPLYQITK